MKHILHKILNLVLGYKELDYLLKQKKHVNSKILESKFHNFTMKGIPINTKRHTKTACSSKVPIQHINTKTLQFYKGYSTYIYQINAL